MLILKLILFFFYKSVHSTTFPSFSLNSTISVPNSNSLGQDNCKQLEITSQRIYRLGQSNVIGSWFKNGSGYTEYSNLQIIPWQQKIYSFTVKNDQTQINFNQINSKNLYNLNSSTLQLISQTTPTISNNISSTFKTATKYLLTTHSSPSVSSQGVSILNIGNLTANGTVTNFFMVGYLKSKVDKNQMNWIVWNKNGRIANSRMNSSSFTIFNPIGMGANYNFSLSNDVQISPDATRMILQFDNASNLTVYNLTSGLKIASIAFPSIIKKVEFIDSGSRFALFHSNNISIYYTDNLSLIESISHPYTLSNNLQLDIQKKLIINCQLGQISIYPLMCSLSNQYFASSNNLDCIPVAAVSNCQAYNTYTGICNQCDPGYNLILGNNTCESNLTSNQTQSSTINTIQSQHSFNINTIFVSFTLSGYSAIASVVTYSIFILQAFPLASLFLRFINYWSLTCLYVLLNMKIPSFLRRVHEIVYDAVNANLSDMFNITLPQLQLTSIEMKNQTYSYFNIETDFIKANFQNLFMLFFSVSISCLLVYGRKIFSKKSLIYKSLNWSLVDIIGGQSIGLIAPLFLPAKQFITQFYSYRFQDRINYILNIVIICISILLPSLLLWLQISSNRRQEKIEQIRKNMNVKSHQTQKSMRFQQSQSDIMFTNNQQNITFWYYFINVTFPITLILPTQIPFFVINFFVLLQITKASTKIKQYRKNTIILSLYLLIFHVGYILLYFLQDFYVSKYISFACVFVFLIGGVHELLTLVFCAAYEIYIGIKKLSLNKVNDANLVLKKQTKLRQIRQVQITKVFNQKIQEKIIQRESYQKQKQMSMIPSLVTLKKFRFKRKNGVLSRNVHSQELQKKLVKPDIQQKQKKRFRISLQIENGTQGQNQNQISKNNMSEYIQESSNSLYNLKTTAFDLLRMQSGISDMKDDIIEYMDFINKKCQSILSKEQIDSSKQQFKSSKEHIASSIQSISNGSINFLNNSSLKGKIKRVKYIKKSKILHKDITK